MYLIHHVIKQHMGQTIGGQFCLLEGKVTIGIHHLSIKCPIATLVSSFPIFRTCFDILTEEASISVQTDFFYRIWYLSRRSSLKGHVRLHRSACLLFRVRLHGNTPVSLSPRCRARLVLSRGWCRRSLVPVIAVGGGAGGGQ